MLQTYLYNLETAAKDGVATTGNGVNVGSKIGVSPIYIELKPGKKPLEDVFAKVGNGIYITDLQGAHAGLNPTSGNFSLKASGFMIEDGKLTKPVNLITVSGNLLQLFKDIEEIGFCYMKDVDVVRHRLVKKVINAYDEYYKKHPPKEEE